MHNSNLTYNTFSPVKLLLKALYGFIILSIVCCQTSCEVLPNSDSSLSPTSDTNAPIASGSSVYTIKQGSHSSTTFSIRRASYTAMRFEVTFDSTAVYETVKPNNQADINKLYGMSDGNSHHHTNSARFGWRWYNNRLEVLAYTYVNKERKFELIDTVALNKPYVYELRLEDNKYVFLLNEKRVEMPRAFTGKGEGLLLYPYFGGDEVAPHDIKIVIRELPTP